MAKVKLDLRKKTDSELLAFANAHKAAITGNASFATPIPTAAVFDPLITSFNTSLTTLAAARTALAQAMTAKETARDALEGGITQRGGYVDAQSGGDELKIESVAFGVRGATTPIGELAAPGNLVSTYGDNEGEIDLGWNPPRGANSFEIQCKVNNDAGAWQQVKTTTASSLTVTGLTPGAVYAFRVRAVGAAGPGAWSDVNVRRAP